MIIKINNKTSLELYKEQICGSMPQCVNCSKKYINTRIEQSSKKLDGDCLVLFCCKKEK